MLLAFCIPPPPTHTLCYLNMRNNEFCNLPKTLCHEFACNLQYCHQNTYYDTSIQYNISKWLKQIVGTIKNKQKYCGQNLLEVAFNFLYQSHTLSLLKMFLKPVWVCKQVCQAFWHKKMDEKCQFLSLHASYLPIQVLKTSLLLITFLNI